MADALIVTSIPPQPSRMARGKETGPAYIAQCLESWRRAGFGVLSINPASEIDALQALALPVNVQKAEASGLPPIAELVAAASSSGCQLAGILNADCHILPFVDLKSNLFRRSRGRMLLCERIDRDAHSLLPLPETYGGFDGFFFDPQAISGSALAECDPGFRLGDVWWDFWFPCLAMGQGLEVGRLMQPVLGHLNHAFRWNPEVYAANRDRFAGCLAKLGGQALARPELTAFAGTMGQVAKHDPANFALITRRWLRNSSDCRELALQDYPASLAEEYLALLQSRRHQPSTQSESPFPLDEELSMRAGGAGCRHLAGGWSFPEGWGCWIDGHCGELSFGPAHADGDLQVELTLRAHVNDHAPEQAVTVCVNDVPLASEVLADNGERRIGFGMPRRMVKDAMGFRLSIWASRPHSPRRANGSADDRQLGVGVTSVCVRPS